MFALVATQGGMGCPNRAGVIALPLAMRAAELAWTRVAGRRRRLAAARRWLERPDLGTD
jgi:hypothetical protein